MSIILIRKVISNLISRTESSIFKLYLILFKATFLNLISTEFKGVRNIEIGRNCEFGSNVIISVISGGKITIEDDVIIYPFVKISTQGGNIVIKKGTIIHSFCVLYGYTGIEIGMDCGIATSSIFVGGNHNFEIAKDSIWSQGCYGKGIVVGDGVWVGSGSRILDGSMIGNGAVIGSGSVVTKDIPANGVAYGNAAIVRSFRGNRKK